MTAAQIWSENQSAEGDLELSHFRKPLKSLDEFCEDVVRRLRKFIAKSLIFLARVCEAKVPHTPYELSQRFRALRSSFDEGLRRGPRPARATDRECRP